MSHELCTTDCNHCHILTGGNYRLLTKVLNELHDKFGNEVYQIVQRNCPNLTCCADCHIDDFCHRGGCELVEGSPKGEYIWTSRGVMNE